MPRFLQPLLLLLARLNDRELAKVVQFLKVENEILRSRMIKRMLVTPKERRRLLKFGGPSGTAVKELISIVSPETFMRWMRDDGRRAHKKRKRKPGRPKTAAEIRELILRLARENGWRYTRILGELKKLGIASISHSTVVNILKEAGLDPCPKRGEQTWSEFLETQAATLWQCDFFSQNALIWSRIPGPGAPLPATLGADCGGGHPQAKPRDTGADRLF